MLFILKLDDETYYFSNEKKVLDFANDSIVKYKTVKIQYWANEKGRFSYLRTKDLINDKWID